MIINQVVAGSGGGGGPQGVYRVYTIDGSGDCVPSTTADYSNMDLSGITHMSSGYLFYSGFAGNPTITSVDLHNFNATGSSCPYAFYLAFANCVNLTTVDLSGLTTTGTNQYVFSNAFTGCSSLINVDLSSFRWGERDGACQYMFSGSGIRSINLPNLETMGGSNGWHGTFYNCSNLSVANMPKVVSMGGATANSCCAYLFYQTALETMRFESLASILGQSCLSNAFSNCLSLQSVWFYALTPSSFGTKTNQFYRMLYGCTNVTVHFPMAIQSTIGSWSDVTGGFGGTNTTVLYDIVTSLTGADGNTYTRSEKDSTSTATAWTYNDTLYYTSGVSNNTAGVNEPSVADTIYSDAACTTSVTTISAIA